MPVSIKPNEHSTTATAPVVFYLPMHYPVLYQTFLRREISGLVQSGCHVTVVPVLPGGDRRVESPAPVWRPGWAWCTAPLAWIGAYLGRPRLIWRGLRTVWRHPPTHLESCFFLVWSLVFAPLVAREARRRGVTHLHAAWATAPATTAWLVHCLTGIPFSFGAQAYDLYRRGGDNFLVDKCRSAKFIHTTTKTNVTTLTQRSPETAHKILLARRGLSALPPSGATRWVSDEVRLLSVARLVPKKGHQFQLEACALLRERGVAVELKVVGDGPLRQDLIALCHKLGLNDYVEWCGAAGPDEVEQFYAWADVFWHTGVIDAKGDRDGLPNVVPEAMAHEIPVISSDEVGVREAIDDGVTGLVVDPTDPAALADAVMRLRSEPALRLALTARARQWVVDEFLAPVNAAKIAQRIRSTDA